MAIEERPRRPRTGRPASRAAAAPEPALSEELVLACGIALVLTPLLVLLTDGWFLFVASGSIMAAAIVGLLAATLEDPRTADGEEATPTGAAAVPPAATVTLALGSIVLGAVLGGRGWALPAILVPVAGGWLALQGGVAHRAPDPLARADAEDRATTPPSLLGAYIALVVVVLGALLAWFAGVL